MVDQTVKVTFVAFALTALLSGCATTIGKPPAAAVNLRPAKAYGIWDEVLTKHVDRQGRVNFAGLQNDKTQLDRFVAWVYTVGPDNHPQWFATRADVLAYHINAYNALAMYNVLKSGVPQKLGVIGRIRFFILHKIRVGGRRMSLYAYENNVIRPLGDERVHFALNCMAVSCPRLPRSAFRPATVNTALDRAAREFFNNRKYVVVNDQDKGVKLSAILDFYTDDFLADASSLIAYVNRYRRQPIPADYETQFLPYNWAINRQQR